MNARLVRNFKTYFVESRFLPFAVAVTVIIFRVLMFLRRGIADSQSDVQGFLWQYVEPLFRQTPYLSFTLSTICILIISYLISVLNLRYGIIRARTSMPFYIPLIFFSIHPHFLGMNADFPALIFILWSLFPLLASYQFHHSHQYAFQFSTLIAIAGIFQIYALLLFPLWLVGLAAIGRVSLRAIAASIFGVITVSWIIFVLFVFCDNISGFLEPFKRLTEIYDFTQLPSFSVPQWGFIGTMILFTAFFIISDNKQIIRERSFTKKVLIFSILIMFVAIILQVLYLFQTEFWIYIILAFVSIIVAHLYSNTTSRLDILLFFLIFSLFILYFCLNVFTDLSPF